jgi:hypothetical protein
MVFKMRDLFVRQRNQLINALSGHLMEYGVIVPRDEFCEETGGTDQKVDLSRFDAAPGARLGQLPLKRDVAFSPIC